MPTPTPGPAPAADELSLDLNLLRPLALLVQEKSVSRAAERLGVTQPAMSASLKRLREAFGDPILVRTGSQMSPTPRALEMAERIAPLLATTRELLRPARGFDPARTRATFTLMGSDYIQFRLLPALVERLAREAPQVALVQRPANPRKVLAWMESGQVDLGIGYLPDPPEHLRTRLVSTEAQVCIVRRGHPVLRGPRAAAKGGSEREGAGALTPERFAELTHVAVSPGGAGLYGARIDALLADLGIRRKVGLTLPSFLAMPYVVARTDHCATVPRRIAEHFARLLPLVIVEPPVRFPAFEISMFWHERVHADLPQVWLRQQVLAAIESETPR